MKPGSVKFFSVLGLLVLGGCASQDMYGPKQTMGGLLGAVGGGVAGAQFGSGTGRLAATGAGALLGGLFGSEAGRSLDRADMMFHRGYPVQPPLVGTRGAASYASPHWSAPAYYGSSPGYSLCRPVGGGRMLCEPLN
jgi:hypothetical protein